MLILLPGLASIACYIVATSQLYVAFTSGQRLRRQVYFPVLIAALVLHGWAVSAAFLTPEGLNRNLFVSLSLMGLLINVIILLGNLVSPTKALGLIAFPLGGTFLAAQIFAGDRAAVVTDYGWQMEGHIALAMFAFAILSMAAAQALLLKVQERLLRSPQMGPRLRYLPPLMTMEQLLFQMIGLGFVLLTLALVSGALFVEDLFGQALVHKTVLSIAGWVVFGALLWGRWRRGWRGRRAINLTLAGFTVLMLAYFGSKFVSEVVLGRV